MRSKDVLIVIVLVAILGTSLLLAARAADVPKQSTFLVIYRPGSAWLPGKPVEEQGLAEHFQYMLDLYEQGAMKQAGPFTDDSGGALILEAVDAAAAQSLIASDPAVRANKMAFEIRPWRLVPWDRHLQKRQAEAPNKALRR